MKLPWTHQGFTLLEMLVSIAIVAMIAIAVYQLNSNAIQNQMRLEEFTLGHMVLMNAVEQYRLDQILGNETTYTEERIRFLHDENEFEVTVNRIDEAIESVVKVEFVLSSVDPDTDALNRMDSIVTYLRKDL